MSMTIGTIAITRSSIAPVSQVVQPRLLAPATVYCLMATSCCAPISVTASIALTALFTIALRASQRLSSPSKKRSQP